MSRGIIRLSVLSILLVLLVGCGGSSGSGGNGPTTVTFAITGAPTAVATQIGSGTFTAATLSGNSLTMSVPEGTTNFAVAYVCPGYSDGYFVEFEEIVVEASTKDGTSFSENCPTNFSPGAAGTLTGSVDASAISGASLLNVIAIGSTYGVGESYGSLDTSFSFSAPEGSDRVEVAAYENVVNGYNESSNLLAAKNFSDVTVPGALNGGNTVVLGASDQVTDEPITYNNVPAGFESPATLVDYMVGNVGGFMIANAASNTYPALPASAAESGDYYYFGSFTTGPGSGATNGLSEVAVETTSTTGAPISFSFPSAWNYAGPTAATLPSFEFAYSGFSSTANVCDQADIIWAVPNSDAEDIILVSASNNYLAGSTTLAIPDLTSLTGFLSAPPSQTEILWEAYLDQLNYPCFQPSSPAEATAKIVYNAGNYTTP
jgi:hypothetical protein